MIAETFEALNEEESQCLRKRSFVWGIEQELEKLAAAIDESSQRWWWAGWFIFTRKWTRENSISDNRRTYCRIKEQIDQGLIEVEQRDGKVFVTVGSGGAFPSGTADLTDEAQRIIDRIALSAIVQTVLSKLLVIQMMFQFQMVSLGIIGI